MPDESQIQPPAGAQPPPQQPQRVVVVSAKSVGFATLLGVFLGPVGLLYSTILGAIVMFFVNMLVGLVTFGFGLFLTWPICGVWAYVAAKSYNDKLLAGQREY